VEEDGPQWTPWRLRPWLRGQQTTTLAKSYSPVESYAYFPLFVVVDAPHYQLGLGKLRSDWLLQLLPSNADLCYKALAGSERGGLSERLGTAAGATTKGCGGWAVAAAAAVDSSSPAGDTTCDNCDVCCCEVSWGSL